MYEYAEVCPVEAQPWLDGSRTSALVANFARLHMLVSLFDGDPEKWIRFIERNGTVAEREQDLPFAQSLKMRLHGDPKLVDDMRRVVRELSTILTP